MSVSWRRTAPYAFAQQRIGKERYTVMDEWGTLPCNQSRAARCPPMRQEMRSEGDICLSMMMSTVIRLEIFQNASVVYKRGSVLVIYICVFVYL